MYVTQIINNHVPVYALRLQNIVMYKTPSIYAAVILLVASLKPLYPLRVSPL